MTQTMTAAQYRTQIASGGPRGINAGQPYSPKRKEAKLDKLSNLASFPHAKGFTPPRMTEHQEQTRLMDVCRDNVHLYPELATLHAIPNGGHRHKAVAVKMKAEGQKPGMPDISLPVPRGRYIGLYIELKAQGGTVSENQYRTMRLLSAQGHLCLVCWGWEEALLEIVKYLEGAA